MFVQFCLQLVRSGVVRIVLMWFFVATTTFCRLSEIRLSEEIRDTGFIVVRKSGSGDAAALASREMLESYLVRVCSCLRAGVLTMVDEVIYTVLGASCCYTVFHLIQAFRGGEFKSTGYGRPPVFAPERRFSPRENYSKGEERRKSVTQHS